jgi:N6-L-threonylcarbamoyladenine synthase
MIILGIETSCDETAASIVRDGKEVLSHIVASSAEMHIKTGGIIPEQAAREQVKSIVPVIEEALKAGCGWNVDNSISPSIDAIAVTAGPGLIGSLLVGVETAKSLAFLWGKPVIPVNHLIAHLYANWLENDPPLFPAVALVVSGGHTDLVLMKDHGELEYIGSTRDDAAGEAFDKTARLLGLPYPGGPSISKAAQEFKGEKQIDKLPRPLIYEDNFDFSFSGLKTHISRDVQKYEDLNEVVNAFSFEVQEAITDVLVSKTLKAVDKYKTPTLMLAGGVAANTRLREKFQEKIKEKNIEVDFRVPAFKYCADNASTIASSAFFNYKPVHWQKIVTNPSLTIMDM